MPPRKFAPTPIETTSKSSRQQKQPNEDTSKPRRFTPQAVETSHKSSKSQSGHVSFSQDQDESTGSIPNVDSTSDKKKVRRFNPVLIDTAQRSHRSSSQDGSSGVTNIDAGNRSDNMEGVVQHGAPDAAPHPEQRRCESPLDGSRPSRLSFVMERQHSFRCPDLDTIESSESERGSAAASSRSSSLGQGSPNTASDSSFTDFYKHATHLRGNVDGDYSKYLLQAEAKKAQQKLREQALAAFPNSDFHEPVQHYVNNDGSSDEIEIEDRPVTWDGFDEDEIIERIARNRQDSAKIPWEQQELQRHAEKMEAERNAEKNSTDQRSQAAWWMEDARPNAYQQENEIRSMRDRARPPMLGKDLTFPRCSSPQPARFDVTQGAATLKKQCQQAVCSGSPVKSNDGGLWCAPPKQEPPKPPPTKSPNGPGGLWGGFFLEDADSPSDALAPPTVQTGLMTPRRGSQVNPFEEALADLPTASHVVKTPGSPPTSLPADQDAEMADMGTVLVSDADLDAQIEREFPDTFVTQVFNYLSLGYPSLARPFDAELAKITRVSLADLRSDDARARQDARGYIRLGPDFEPATATVDGAAPVTEETCVRWKALKLYIREWARQEKNMVSMDAAGGNWGTTARRGSWAF